MSARRESLGRHIAPAVDGARLERQRAAVAAGVRRRTARGARLRRAGAGLSAGGVAILLVWALVAHRAGPMPAPRSPSGTVIDAAAGGETLTLPDGSRARMEANSRLKLADARAESIRLELERGGVTLDVVPSEHRPFVVAARGYEARVLGTRFSVRLGDDHGPSPSIEVEVTRGKVRVTRAGDEGDPRTLVAGERWSATLGGATAAAEATPAPSATDPLVPPQGRAGGPAGPIDLEPSERPRAPRAAGATPATGPRELLAQAEAARAADRPRDSARLLEALRTRHRHDPRAGLAAFELGRLRADRLGDPAGAAEAFADAIALAPDAPFREDAQARLVEARAAEGDRSGCALARAAYLARYPAGVHRPKIALLCPP